MVEGDVQTLQELLPEDLRTDEGLAKFNDVAGLAKSYKEIESRTNGLQEELEKAIHLPGEDADDTTRAAFYQKLGCPGRAEDYPKIVFEGVPEGTETDKTVENAFRAAAHKAGLSSDQFKTVADFMTKQQLVALDTFVKQDEGAEKEAVIELTSYWGGEDKRKENVELARRLVKKYDGEDNKVASFLEDTRLGSFAPLVKLLGDIAKDVISEETTATGTPSTETGMTARVSETTGEPVLVYDKSPELNK